MTTEGRSMSKQQKRPLPMYPLLLVALSSIIALFIAPFLIWIDVQIPANWPGDSGLEHQSLLVTDVFLSYILFMSVLGLIIVAVDSLIPILPPLFSLRRENTAQILIIICIGLSGGVCLLASIGAGGFAEYQTMINEKNEFYSFGEFKEKASFQLGIGLSICIVGIGLAGLLLFLHYLISKHNWQDF